MSRSTLGVSISPLPYPSCFDVFVLIVQTASATVGGIVAAIMANVVLFAYIFVAWKDDQAEREADAKQKAKKAQ